MAEKNTTNIVIIIALIALAAFLFMKKEMPTTPTTNINVGSTDFLQVRFYDDQGNLISSSKQDLQSVVQGISGVSQIDFTTTVQNTGTTALTCTLGIFTPSSFDASMPKSVKNVVVGGSASWTSAKIGVAQFEPLVQPVRFTAVASCTYVVGTTTFTVGPRSGFIDLTITAESTTGNFNIQLGQGGSPTQYCGDGICQAANEETALSCPTDCTVSAGNVKFRTTDNTYVSGSRIAATQAACGSTLTSYGYSSSGVGGGGSAYCSALTGYTLITGMTPPGACYRASGTLSPSVLYRHNTDTTLLRICTTGSTASGSCLFDSDVTTGTAVSTAPGSTQNPSLEQTC